MDERTGRLILMALLGAWIVFPDLIPGHIDDIIAIFALISQVSSYKKSGPDAIDTDYRDDLELK